MKSKKFDHRALQLVKTKLLVYTALSKRLFYFRMFICKYVLEQDKVPLNPFMVFDYFLLDVVARDRVRQANNTLLQKSDELWIFGSVSNGVLAEIKIFKSRNLPVRYYTVTNDRDISEVQPADADLEDDVKEFRHEL